MQNTKTITLPHGSERKIAKRTGLSEATVTRALKGDISTEERLKVRTEAIKIQRKLHR